MIIQINGNMVDFEAPIYIIESKRGRFIKGLKEIFGDKFERVENIIESKKEMGDTTKNLIKFSKEDLAILADSNLSNEEIAAKLGKSPFAIQMKRGGWLIELQGWVRKKGRDKINKKDIANFIEEKFK